MTTRLEVEHSVSAKGRRTRKVRETLLEVDDRKGVHETEFGTVQVDAKHVQIWYEIDFSSLREPGPYWLDIFYNRDIIIDARQAPELAKRLKSAIRRISVGGDGNGSQQIGKEVTLFVHTDLFQGEKR